MNCPHCQAPIKSGDYSCLSCNAQLRPPPLPGEDLTKNRGWHWSPLTGIMYNGIPVGILIVGACALLYFVAR
jgi:hypothetical protein